MVDKARNHFDTVFVCLFVFEKTQWLFSQIARVGFLMLLYICPVTLPHYTYTLILGSLSVKWGELLRGLNELVLGSDSGHG